MNNLKLRVWYPKEKKMVYLDRIIIGTRTIGFCESDDSYVDIDMYSDDEEAIIMLETGLLDKNGKRIFVGDIIEIGTTYMIPKEKCLNHWSICEVKFGKGEINGSEFRENITGFYLDPITHYTENLVNDDSISIEILGNIYEQPNLLNTKND